MTAVELRVNGQRVDEDAPITYMQRTRDYYLALGYDNPYRWAHYAEVPFAPLKVALSKARIGLVTTAAPFQPDKGDQGPGAPYNSAAKFYRVYSSDTRAPADLRISHIGYDRIHTTATDPRCWFPPRCLEGRRRERAHRRDRAALPRPADQPKPGNDH